MSTTNPTAHPQHDKMLSRVRALLAKAESTTFPAEAEALTEKAQKLMADYAIDQALVTGQASVGPDSLDIFIESPYQRAKCSVLTEVAVANRCKVIWAPHNGQATVFGFPADLEITDLLFTSLLVQASVAMAAAGKNPANAEARSRSFRRAFLMAFGHRIGERLRATNAESVAQAVAVHGTSLAPVLASRAAEIDNAIAKAFPHLRRSRSSASFDAAGWSAGRSAADRASLGTRGALAR